jgi:hypothetical protein
MSLSNVLGFILSLTVSSVVLAQTPAEKLQQAEKLYSERAYDAAGAAKAQQAADLYLDLAKNAAAQGEFTLYMAKRSEALNFVGTALTSKEDKIRLHQAGIDAADEGIKPFVTDAANMDDAAIEKLKSLPADTLNAVALGIYMKAANLGQWGQANGVTSSLGKWPEMRSLLENVIKLGKREVVECGPFRALGRAYYKIPALFGGDNRKSEKYLSQAVSLTLIAGKTISRNGHTNLYHAEVLAALGQKAKAKSILQEFIATTAKDAGATMIPEYEDAQKAAKDLLPRI